MSPTQRSLKKLRQDGWLVAIVEKYNYFTKQRADLWEFGDLLAVKKNEVLIVQTTSGANVSKRVAKICAEPVNVIAEFWLESPTRRIEVHGWRKVGPRGKRKKWECRVVDLYRNELMEGKLMAIDRKCDEPQ